MTQNVTLKDLADAVLAWASSGRDHGGNPYCLQFVKLARRATGDDDEDQAIADGRCTIPDCPRKGRHTERQRRALERRQRRARLDDVTCIGCHSGIVPWNQGSDYCAQCVKRDARA